MAQVTEHQVVYASDQKQITYLAAGPEEGPLLIFLHGWPAVARTWSPQLAYFSSRGFRCIAPDMPGYGKSTSRNEVTDHSCEAVVSGLLVLLSSLDHSSAIWIGHDWGAGILSTLVAVHPDIVCAAVWISVPYRSMELGLDHLRSTVNRDTYPEDIYPNGQWDYQVFYQKNFDMAVTWYDRNSAAFLDLFYGKGQADACGTVAPTANWCVTGGRFRGGDLPRPGPFPTELCLLDEATYVELVEGMSRTGWAPACSYYMNHDLNQTFIEVQHVNGGTLEMPTLFIEGKYDLVCDTMSSGLAAPMKKACKKLEIVSLEAGHWVALERHEEVNKAIEEWLKKEDILKGHMT